MNENEYLIDDDIVIPDEIKHLSEEELDKEIDELEKSLGLTKSSKVHGFLSRSDLNNES